VKGGGGKGGGLLMIAQGQHFENHNDNPKEAD